jgi:hypothetical protein
MAVRLGSIGPDLFDLSAVSRLRPAISFGVGRPAASRNVGAKSRKLIRSSIVRRAGMVFGQEIAVGKWMPYSYRLALARGKDMPLSEQTTINVLASSPALSILAMIRPS